MLLFAMLIGALHAAFEHAVESLNGIGGHVATHIFVFPMVDGFVAGELLADLFIGRHFVGHQASIGLDVGANDRLQIGDANAIDVEAAGRTATLNEGDDRAGPGNLNKTISGISA